MNRQGLEKLSEVRDAIWKLQQIVEDRRFLRGASGHWSRNPLGYLYTNQVGDVLAMGDGGAGAPTYTFIGDTDTGIYRVGANQLGIASGGVLIATIDATGLTLLLGTNINEFSIDGTMAGNSDDAVPTERAVVSYTSPHRLYDATVAPAGGDYTDIQSAITAGATSIFVRSGTYTVGADIVLPDGAVIVGEDKDKTILDFNNAAFQMHASGAAGAGNEFSNIRIENITFTKSEDTNGALYFFHVTNSIIRNCIFVDNGDRGCYLYYPDGCTVQGCYFTGHDGDYALEVSSLHDSTYGAGVHIRGNNFYYNKYNAYVGSHWSKVLDNDFVRNTSTYNLHVNAWGIVITGNVFKDHLNRGITLDNSCSYNLIDGNFFEDGTQGITIEGLADYNIISNNIYRHLSSTGILCYGDYNRILGNFFDSMSGAGDEGIKLIAGADNNYIANNSFRNCREPIQMAGSNNVIDHNHIEWQAGTTVDILDTGTTNEIIGDQGINDVTVKEYRLMQNTSGGALVAGDVVTFKAVAAGNEFTTTVNQGDDLVWGMLAENIADNAWGKVQVLGKTTLLKVDGTIDIAIGDFIGTFTAAGIGMQAQAGDMAIAIALEGYTNDDSNGVIDALLITQRKI